MNEILSNFLSRNTSSVIIGYLTDPPPLPYLKDLLHKTRFISYCDDYIFYINYWYWPCDFITKVYNKKYAIKRDKTDWRITRY